MNYNCLAGKCRHSNHLATQLLQKNPFSERVSQMLFIVNGWAISSAGREREGGGSILVHLTCRDYLYERDLE